MRCRTAACGGHAKRCEQGHVVGVWYNGCGHRSCPRCAWRKTQQWLVARTRELLPCDHFHVVFTIPSRLRILWEADPKLCAEALFGAVSRTLLQLLATPANLGVVPGMTLALHTWTKTLLLHPHIHALVTGGGLTEAGEWKACRNGYLLPVRMMVLVYRGKLLSALERAVRSEQLRLPHGMSRGEALELLREAAAQKWSVWVAQRYAHGEGVMTYLSRYLRGGPVRDSRVLGYDGEHVDLALRTGGSCRMSGAELVRRLAQHVPLPHLRVVRHYGVYAHTQRAARELCRSQLVDAAVPEPEDKGTAASAPPACEPCPICGARTYALIIPRGGAPPWMQLSFAA